MILTRHFVFIHIPKTGGTTARRLLEHHAPAEWDLQILGDHPTYEDIPKDYEHLPRLAFVRNPFSWYVSWYHFQTTLRDDFFLEISDGGRLGFGESMRRAFTSGPALELGEGPFTQYLWMMLGRGLLGTRIGKMEHLREDLATLLGECCEIPDSMAEAIRTLEVRNPSKHEHYSSYYDAELRELIQQKDKAVFAHFGYEWEDADEAGSGDQK